MIGAGHGNVQHFLIDREHKTVWRDAVVEKSIELPATVDASQPSTLLKKRKPRRDTFRRRMVSRKILAFPVWDRRYTLPV